MTKILIADALSTEGVNVLEQEEDFQIDNKPKITPEELKDEIGDYDVLLVRSRTKVTRDIIEAAKNLKIIGRAGAGVDTIDIPAATDKGIIVMNTPGGNTVSTAEYSIAMVLALMRNIPQAHQSMVEGKWEKKQLKGNELNKKVLGIIGFGRVGREVAQRLHAFGMRIIAYDPYVAPEILSEYAAESVDFNELIQRSDVVTIHSPGGDDTRDLISKKELDMMKPTAFLVNCARGGIVNIDDLMEALKNGKIAGAAVDVYEKEPLDEDHPMRKCPNLVLSPHLGASTKEAQTSVAIQIAQQVIEAVKMNVVRNAVNAPSIDPELLSKMRPYLQLAEKIGKFHAQFAEKRVTTLVMKYTGSVLAYPVEHITTAALKGFLQNISDETVNYINAPVKASEYGIKFEETKTSYTTPYENLITVEAETEEGEVNSVSATLFLPDNPRFVIVNDKHFDAYPEGNLIVIENRDRPGIIGNVGTLLGEHNINVAQMTWGRTDHSEDAMTVINVDQKVTDELLEEIGKLPNIMSARLIKL